MLREPIHDRELHSDVGGDLPPEYRIDPPPGQRFRRCSKDSQWLAQRVVEPIRSEESELGDQPRWKTATYLDLAFRQ